MKKPIGAAFAVLAFAAISVPAHSARVREEPPKPGYHCQVGRAFDDATWGSATLDAAGIIHEMDWTWRTPLTNQNFQLLILGGMASVEGNRIADSGTAFLSWQLPPLSKGHPPKRFAQFTSSAQQSYLWSAFASGETERSYTPNVHVFWPDLLAFARSAPALNLNLFDERRRFIESQPIDRNVFIKADSEIKAMLAALNAKVTKYEAECTKVDDIINRDIVV